MNRWCVDLKSFWLATLENTGQALIRICMSADYDWLLWRAVSVLHDIWFSFHNENVNTSKGITVDWYSGTGCGFVCACFFPTPFYQNLFATHSSSIVRKCRPLIPSEEIWSLAKTAFFGEFSPVLVVSACTSAWFHVHFYLCNNTFPHFKLLFRLSYMRWPIMTVIAVVSCCLYLTLYIQYSGKTYSFIAERNHRRCRWVS